MDIFNLLNTNSEENYSSPYFFGQTKKSFLLGPNINKKTCIDCFKARLKSSSLFNIKVYLRVSKNSLQLILKMARLKDLEDKMIELDKKTGKILFVHYLSCTPGCKKNKNEQQE